MIKYLQRLRAKKGFTLIELLVVIAIIAVLAAVILVAMSPDEGKRREANTNATTFYSTMQYIFTKYSKYEADLNSAVGAEIAAAKAAGTAYFIEYDKNIMGNYPTNKYTYVCMCVEKSDITYVHVNGSLTGIITDTRTDSTMTELEKQIVEDIENSSYIATDGYYYALIKRVEMVIDTVENKKAYNVLVDSAYYSHEPLEKTIGSDLAAYREKYLMFADVSKLANGVIMGVCTSTKDASGRYLGQPGSYFMNVDSALDLT